MLKAYFDASRTEVQKGVYLIGGYVGTEPFWTEFENEWRERLAYWEISDFHLTECLASPPQGQFRNFDTHRAQLCALNFGKVIQGRKPTPIYSGVVEEDWFDMKATDAFRTRYPSPYQFLFQDVLHSLATWGNRHAPNEMIAPIFDLDADPRSVEAIHKGLKESPLYNRLAASVTWGSRKTYLPIQAADILAGEMQRDWFKFEYGPSGYQGVRNLLHYAAPGMAEGGLWTPETLAKASAAFDRNADPFNWSGAT
jgi:hypothetical protein